MMRAWPNHHRLSAQRGFTLLELVIAIVLLGILTTITVFSFDGSKSRGQMLVSVMEEYGNAMIRMKADTACYPTRLSALFARTEAASSLCGVSLESQWNGPYVKDARVNAAGAILMDQIAPTVTLDFQTAGLTASGTTYLIRAVNVPGDILLQALLACNGSADTSATLGTRCLRGTGGGTSASDPGSLSLKFAQTQ